MKIAILSDVHDNIWKLETLLASLEAQALIFCGDFCAPFTPVSYTHLRAHETT